QVLQDPDHAAAASVVRVTGNGHEVDGDRNGDGAQQIGHEDHGPAQDADQDQGTASVIPADLLPQLLHPAGDLLLVDQNLPDIRIQGGPPTKVVPILAQGRSEEHTSELQSRENLVCRLL